jgi:PIN domain nuclease of toxin-antitoxin system
MLNLDTHILIYGFADQLKPKEKTLLASNPWSISGIVLWELAKLSQLGRIDLDPKDREFQHFIRKLHVWPLNWEICQQSTALDFHSDPADELIAATSIVHQIPLMTRDKTIKRSKRVPWPS